MTDQATAEVLDPTTTDIEALAADPKPFILDTARGQAFLDQVRREVASIPADTSTQKARNAIRSGAARVSRVKNLVDKSRTSLTESLRDQVKQINAAGNGLVAQLAAIQADIRLPLTEWEGVELKRIEVADRILDELRDVIRNGSPSYLSSDDIQENLQDVEKMRIDAARFGSDLALAQGLHGDALARLEADFRRAKTAEAEKAELEKLREEKIAAMEKEEADRLERERAEVEAERIAEQQRLKVQAAEREKDEAEARHKRELAQAEQRREEEIERERETQRREKVAAEEAAQKERDRLKAEADAERKADERRASNARHRLSVMDKASASLSEHCEMPLKDAAKIVDLINVGRITNIQINF